MEDEHRLPIAIRGIILRCCLCAFYLCERLRLDMKGSLHYCFTPSEYCTLGEVLILEMAGAGLGALGRQAREVSEGFNSSPVGPRHFHLQRLKLESADPVLRAALNL